MASRKKKNSISVRPIKKVAELSDGERYPTGYSEAEVLEKCKKLYNNGTSVWIGIIAYATGDVPIYGSYTKNDIELAGVFDKVLKEKFVHHIISK